MDTTPLKREFDHAVTQGLPQGHVDEHDYRQEQIPGGYETFSRDAKANSGVKHGDNGANKQFRFYCYIWYLQYKSNQQIYIIFIVNQSTKYITSVKPRRELITTRRN